MRCYHGNCTHLPHCLSSSQDPDEVPGNRIQLSTFRSLQMEEVITLIKTILGVNIQHKVPKEAHTHTHTQRGLI